MSFEANGAAVSSFLDGALTIDATPGEERIVHDGREMEITARQAALLAILANAFGHTVGLDFIIGKMFGANPPKTAEGQLSLLVGDLKTMLPGGVGLSLLASAGVGLQLKTAHKRG
jgi:hypothetical protein